MKGLLLKDFYLIKKYCRAVLVIALIFTAISGFEEGNVLFLFYPCIITSLLPVTLQAYDERDKWISYCGTLPYTKAQLVSAKYMISLITGGIMVIVTAITQAVLLTITNTFSMDRYLTTLISLFTITLLSPAVIMPFIFRFGSEKGRLVYYAIIGLSCGSAAVISTLGIELFTFNGSLAFILISLISVLLFIGSWALSIKIYQKRELC